MTEVLSAESIIANLSGQIDFEWVAVQDDSDLPSHTINSSQHATLVGHLNLVHKNLIQVIGATECEYLQGLEESFRNNMLDEIFSAHPAAIIMADGIPVPDMLISYANNYQTPLLSCKTDSIPPSRPRLANRSWRWPRMSRACGNLRRPRRRTRSGFCDWC